MEAAQGGPARAPGPDPGIGPLPSLRSRAKRPDQGDWRREQRIRPQSLFRGEPFQSDLTQVGPRRSRGPQLELECSDRATGAARDDQRQRRCHRSSTVSSTATPRCRPAARGTPHANAPGLEVGGRDASGFSRKPDRLRLLQKDGKSTATRFALDEDERAALDLDPAHPDAPRVPLRGQTRIASPGASSLRYRVSPFARRV